MEEQIDMNFMSFRLRPRLKKRKDEEKGGNKWKDTKTKEGSLEGREGQEDKINHFESLLSECPPAKAAGGENGRRGR